MNRVAATNNGLGLVRFESVVSGSRMRSNPPCFRVNPFDFWEKVCLADPANVSQPGRPLPRSNCRPLFLQ
jgi:hypothetical protein